MKLGASCLLCLLLSCLALPVPHGSMEIRSKDTRNPDIDPSWYTGRGIRPVGRFGRRRALGEGPWGQGGGGDRWPPCVPPPRQPPAPPPQPGAP
ncbi:prolactin-releasing peptide [Apus apus]|uniref:prolactin-releasing peptide n=1 Tax=Apus apus TaxID=8895 RepID=UPI0021F8C634|nr:prolactin-releasing peptide [Apus apus]